MTWRIKNWTKFQHYKHRDPPWIKLHRGLLNDPEWFALSGDASKLLANCWLLASENNGELPPLSTVAFRLRMTEKRAAELFLQLKHWLETDASMMLAERKQVATTETETETETEKNIDQTAFDRFWKAYPRRVGKKVAEKALAKALRETSIDTIIGALVRQTPSWTDPKFIPHPATWLNAGRWADEVGETSTGPPRKEFVPDATMPTREELEQRYARRSGGKTESSVAVGAGLLASGIPIRRGQANGMVHGETGKQTVRGLARIFPRSGLETFCNSDARAGHSEGNNDAD